VDALVVEHVLRAVECVPPGRVTTYGAIAALVGGTARQVGSVMRFYGNDVAWWRVVNAAGELPPELLARARPRWDEEGISLAESGRGCRLGRHRVEEGPWAEAYDRATADLPPIRRRHA